MNSKAVARVIFIIYVFFSARSRGLVPDESINDMECAQCSNWVSAQLWEEAVIINNFYVAVGHRRLTNDNHRFVAPLR